MNETTPPERFDPWTWTDERRLLAGQSDTMRKSYVASTLQHRALGFDGEPVDDAWRARFVALVEQIENAPTPGDDVAAPEGEPAA